jgi:hypothetical protein
MGSGVAFLADSNKSLGHASLILLLLGRSLEPGLDQGRTKRAVKEETTS